MGKKVEYDQLTMVIHSIKNMDIATLEKVNIFIAGIEAGKNLRRRPPKKTNKNDEDRSS